MKALQSIKLRAFGGGKRCDVRIDGLPNWFHFADLVEFSQGVALLVRLVDGLHAPGALHPADRTFMQLDSVYIEDAGERNKRVIAAREVKERRAAGEMLAGGAWYMELCINGSATDCSFNTAHELFQQLQQIIRREMQQNGQIAVVREAANA